MTDKSTRIKHFQTGKRFIFSRLVIRYRNRISKSIYYSENKKKGKRWGEAFGGGN
jgi:hypothetical protein